MKTENVKRVGPTKVRESGEEGAVRAILEGIPEEHRQGLAKRAKMAPKSYPAAVYLMCMSCSGWDRKEAQLCGIRSCPLFPHRTRLFKSRAGKTSGKHPRRDRSDLAETA